MKRHLRVACAVLCALPYGLIAPTEGVKASTSCSFGFSWSQQWTSHTSHFYHPGTGCPHDDAYYGWAGINGQIVTPAFFPGLGGDTRNHSAGWLDIGFDYPSSHIQIGWLAGCAGTLCNNSGLGLYIEKKAPSGTDEIFPEGSLNYNTADIYEIYYAGSGKWKIFDNYQNLLLTVMGFPSSGSPTVGSEVYNGYSPNSGVDMPYATYGYSSPGTNATLRIKGANGWVDWTTSLSTGSTADYDESNCPNPTYCPGPNAWAYYLTMLHANYNFQAHGIPTPP